MDKQAKAEVDAAVEEAKASPEPSTKDLWTDIYYKGTEPPYMRGREREEVRANTNLIADLLTFMPPGSLLLSIFGCLVDSGLSDAYRRSSFDPWFSGKV